MPRHVRIAEYGVYGPDLSIEHISHVCGALFSGFPSSLYGSPQGEKADLVVEETIPLNKIPEKPIIKMTNARFIDEFFTDGSLRLGTFSYYNAFDHEEIGDISEGFFIVVGRNAKSTGVALIAGGFDNYVLCCYAGEPDPACVQRFGYDACFEIVDPEGFAEAISQKLGASCIFFSECAYSENKIVVGAVPEDFSFHVLSARLFEMANEAKYFVKPLKYSHQCEFTFVWQMPSDVQGYLDIKCPEAIRFCRRR